MAVPLRAAAPLGRRLRPGAWSCWWLFRWLVAGHVLAGQAACDHAGDYRADGGPLPVGQPAEPVGGVFRDFGPYRLAHDGLLSCLRAVSSRARAAPMSWSGAGQSAAVT